MVVRLFSLADLHWPNLVARYYTIDLLEVPLTKFLDLVYAWLREVIDPDQWEQFEAQLEAPVPGTSRTISDASAQAEGESFLNAMNTLQRG